MLDIKAGTVTYDAPAFVKRKFIGGPCDGWEERLPENQTGISKQFRDAKPPHKYKLGTVNGEQMMVYERENK